MRTMLSAKTLAIPCIWSFGAGLVLPWVWLSGCVGVIEGPAETQGVPSPPQAAGRSESRNIPGTTTTVMTAADKALASENAALFEAATRYFPGDGALGSDPRLFRLTRSQLDVTTRTLLPELYTTQAVAALPRDPLQTNYEYADILGFNAANFTPYVRWVDELSEGARAMPQRVVDCQAMDTACLQKQASRFVSRAFRGLASAQQSERYSSFFTTEVTQLGLSEAVADLVSLTLTSPSYVFRDEVPRAGTQLSAAQHLQALTYALADAPPEALGLDAAAAQQAVASPKALSQTVDTILASDLAREKLVRFFIAWLEVREPQDFTISTEFFPEFTPEVARAAVDDTVAFLRQKLVGATPSLHALTRASDAVVSDVSAPLYGLKQGSGGKLKALAAGERFGIFTQPAVIASHSGPTTTRLIKRGVFFTRKVMCLPLGLPPAGVDTTLPASEQLKTERERVEQATQAPLCQGCHAMINPFGFMQESYDAIGRFRTRDNGQPLDTNVTFNVLGDAPVTAQSSIEALTAITDSLLFQQCFTRQLFRFYTGREEVSADDPLLREMFFRFADEGQQDLQQMLRTLATSPSFSQRQESP